MPSRMIDYDAIWTSDKLALCKETFRHEYLWLYGLADANGCFEINLNAIRSRVAVLRPKLGCARLQNIFDEFEAHGLLFIWASNRKRYGFWTNSDRPGRLPPTKERHRYKRFAPDIPKEGLTEYLSRANRDAIVSGSPTGVGVGIGVGIGDGIGVGDGAPGARGVGALLASPASSASAPASSSGTLAQTASDPHPFEKESTSKTKPRKGIFCYYCENFFSESEFQKHKCAAQTRSGWECITCHATLKTISELKTHRQTNHKSMEQARAAASTA
jgi:hypothetical protein